MSEGDAMARLGTPACLAFPFRVGAAGPAVSRGADYVREQIEQVLFTTPGERVFRSEFGAGVKTLTFEPNNQPLWEVTRRRILAALTAALRGEIPTQRARRLGRRHGRADPGRGVVSAGVDRSDPAPAVLRRGHRSWLTYQPPRSYSPAARPIRAAGLRTACRARCPRSATTSTGSRATTTVSGCS